MRLDRAVKWFLEHQDAPPIKLHRRGVWHDETGGSGLGTPDWTRDFERWLAQAEATITDRFGERCRHPGQTEDDRLSGVICLTCCAWREGPAGARIADHETGWVQREQDRFRWPMRAALAALARQPIRRGRPNPAEVLRQLAMAEGDMAIVGSAFAGTYPALGDPAVMTGYIAWSLGRLRLVYREQPPARMRGPRPERSQAQLDAEAAAP